MGMMEEMATIHFTEHPLLQRTHWYLANLDTGDGYSNRAPVAPGDKPYQYNLIGSSLPNGMHAPAIDIDLPCKLYPSRTPGHFHLYIDKEMTWEQYEKILEALTDARVVQRGYYEASKKHRQSFLRAPGIGQPSCTLPAESALDTEEIRRLISTIRALLGTTVGDGLDLKLTCMEDRVYEILATKIDEIVARRVQRAAVSSVPVQKGSDKPSDLERGGRAVSVSRPRRRDKPR
jgi:hypothetical protein